MRIDAHFHAPSRDGISQTFSMLAGSCAKRTCLGQAKRFSSNARKIFGKAKPVSVVKNRNRLKNNTINVGTVVELPSVEQGASLFETDDVLSIRRQEL